MNTVNLNSTDCFIKKGKYVNNDRISLRAFETETGYPYATLTVNLPDVPLNENQACIDVNNLGESIVKDLIENKIIEPTNYVATSGFCSYPIVNILI